MSVRHSWSDDSEFRKMTAYPDSAVPVAFDRGHLYSPTLEQARWALGPGTVYELPAGQRLRTPSRRASRHRQGSHWGIIVGVVAQEHRPHTHRRLPRPVRG